MKKHLDRIIDEELALRPTRLNAVRTGAMSIEGARTELEAMNKRHDAELQAFAERVREHIIVPLCRKYHLRFTSGMGMYDFDKGPGSSRSYSSVEDLDKDDHYVERGLSVAARTALRPVIELLEEEMSNDQSLGLIISDVW